MFSFKKWLLPLVCLAAAITSRAVPPVLTPPTVVINSPTSGANFDGDNCSGPVSVSIKFTAGGIPLFTTITSLTATLDNVPLTFTTTGLNTVTAVGTTSVNFTSTGSHTLSVTAVDFLNKTTTASTTFTVNVVTVPPPSITISQPTNGSTFDYTTGQPALSIPFATTATAGFGNITALTATLDGSPVTLVTTGVGTNSVASGSATFSLSAGGMHTVTVSATDACGDTANASSTFTINVITPVPPPSVTITTPADGSSYNGNQCAGPVLITANFSGSSTGLNIVKLTATLDNSMTPLVFSPSGLGTPTATGSVPLSFSSSGSHTLSVTATDSNGGTASITSNFQVTVTDSPAPSVVITNPENGTIYPYVLGTPALVVPVDFSATAGFGNIVTLSATLDGSPLPGVTYTGVGTAASASGSASLSFTAGGSHTIIVTATDGCGHTSSATSMFTISASTPTPPTVTINSPSDTAIFSGNTCTGAVSVNVSFTATSPLLNIATLTATIDENPLSFVATGLNTLSAGGSTTLSYLSSGMHILSVTATDTYGGSTTAMSTFSIVVVTPANPTVMITSPADGSTASVNSSSLPYHTPLAFNATAGFGNITSLTATLDGNAIPGLVLSGVNTSGTASGSATLSLTSGGPHTIVVTATDQCGNTSTTSSTITLTVITPVPPPNVCVTPAVGTTYNHTDCGTSLQSVTITGTATSTINIVSLVATVDNAPVTLTVTNLNTSNVKGTATLSLADGPHTIVFTATDSKGGSNSATTNIMINGISAPPPTVVLDAPTLTTYTYSGAALNIPFKFHGIAGFGTITSVSAVLDGTTNITLTTTGLNTPTAYGSATLNPTALGQHTITYKVVDQCGDTASDTLTITLKSPAMQCIQGCVYFDVNCDCSCKVSDSRIGIGGMTVKLYNSKMQLVATTTTAANGCYSFNVAPGNYLVVVCGMKGLKATNCEQQQVCVTTSCVTVPPIYYGLDWCTIRGMTACCHDSDYWLCNLQKACSHRCNGMQVSSADLLAYTNAIGSLALPPFSGLTESQAINYFSTNSCSSSAVLAKELLAAEYNYVSGCYIGGNQTLTYLFIYWGECVLQNPSHCNDSYTQYTKQCCSAYNHTGGCGYIVGPPSCHH